MNRAFGVGFDAQHPRSCIPTPSKAGWRCRTGAEDFPPAIPGPWAALAELWLLGSAPLNQSSPFVIPAGVLQVGREAELTSSATDAVLCQDSPFP